MKIFSFLSASLLVGFITGLVVAWPSAHQWDTLMFSQKLEVAVLFFAAGALCSLVVLKLVGRVWVAGDGVRCLGFLLGAALCFSLVRQEIALLVYPALWAAPGTFLGTALGQTWLQRSATNAVLESKPVISERGEQLLSP